VFIPPGWKLNNSSIEVLGKLGFDLAEIQEKFVLLSHKAFKKLKIPKVLNWDSTGYPERNIVNTVKDEKRFKRLIKQKSKIIRIALHPRDPHSALEEQKQMISQLKDLGYMMSTYGELYT
jgi:predicted deacetylase